MTLQELLESKKNAFTRIVVRWYRGTEDNDIDAYKNSFFALKRIASYYLDSMVMDYQELDNLIIIKVKANPSTYTSI